MNGDAVPRGNGHRSGSPTCLAGFGIGLFVVGGVLTAVAATNSNFQMYLYTMGIALLISGFVMFAVGVTQLSAAGRRMRTEGRQGPSAIEAGVSTATGPVGPGATFIANQSRLDMPPSYRSSRLFIAIKDDDEEEAEEGEAQRSPPPSYGDICDGTNAVEFSEDENRRALDEISSRQTPSAANA
ncbi:uncharacterized protein [Diadema antillarum]|uniref:uncharacterized protein n=1 Tax=Diadema antillarum TaxID=105358 RepID=UPI003A8B5BB8